MNNAQLGRPAAVDWALAAVVAALLFAVALVAPGTGPVGYAAVLAGSLALVARRSAPRVVLLVTTAAMLVYSMDAHPGPSAAFPVLVAVFGAVQAGYVALPAAAGTVYLLTGLGLTLSADTGDPPLETVQGAVLLLGWFLAAGVAATITRHRQAYLEQVERRAAEAERTREEAALRRAGEERLRIARELHDSLTHSISVIKVQAGVAVHLARKRGEEAPAALLAIQEASRDAVRELRATLEVLRDPAEGEPAVSGLDRLEELVERARASGVPATVTVEGVQRALPPEVDRAAYRIVQEALTNVSRHAGGTTASVRLGYDDRELVVRVDDEGRASPDVPHVPGVGLLGMRERVTALGGTLAAGPRPEGGFSVRAALPAPEPEEAR
ncbi:sensor histidine kinase [Spongiactinospora rosea]|uniref:histidine kinase n=1 Tax=Spongiactinospora rosea TaxID=2248750 RepID=A0A366LWE3_9ACTN|nr:sensor histidine kinase [Spongiactinospora rosea]RBQ18241.1 sensor histidine kinase [Spongiactinospora rosea]